MDNFIIIISLLLIGIIIRKIPHFNLNTANVLNLFVIYISLPALILLKIPDLFLSDEISILIFFPWFILLISVALILILSKFFRWDNETTGCLLLVIPMGNTSFLGIPMVKAFLGDSAIPYAIIYDQFGSFLALSTYGALIISIYAPGKSHPNVKGLLKKIFSFPPFIALILAFILKNFTYPDVFKTLLTMLAATLIPIVMIAVGFQTILQIEKKMLSPILIGLFLKLLISPFIIFLVCKAFGYNDLITKVSVFEAGMPPMISGGALAIISNLNPKLSATLLGMGILISFLTLPFIYKYLILNL